MFPEFIRYEAVLHIYIQQQTKRIFDVFDVDGDGRVNWPDFYTMISICYYGHEKFLSVLMFIIFDYHLDRKLDRTGLTLLLDLNAIYLREKTSLNNQMKNQN